VVVTLGRHGGFVSHGDDARGDARSHYRFAAETVKAIDTTGAGDAFSGGLAAVDAALALGREAGARCVLNPAPVHPSITRATLDAAGILTPNETEFALLCERFAPPAPAAEHVAALDDASLHALCRRLSSGTVVVTLGRHGGFVSHGDDARGDAQSHYRFVAEAVKAIDTTGAGDAFSGGLAAALCLFPEQAFEHAVRHANRVAALSTEIIGTAPAMPTKVQVEARFGA
jgi:ribokinase